MFCLVLFITNKDSFTMDNVRVCIVLFNILVVIYKNPAFRENEVSVMTGEKALTLAAHGKFSKIDRKIMLWPALIQKMVKHDRHCGPLTLTLRHDFVNKHVTYTCKPTIHVHPL